MMDQAVLKAELRAQVARVQDCEREIDRLHEELARERAGNQPSPPPDWVGGLAATAEALQRAAQRIEAGLAAPALPEPAAPAPAPPPGADIAPRQWPVLREVPPHRFRPYRTELLPHPAEAEAVLVAATAEDGQHSAVHLVSPRAGMAVSELRVVVAAYQLDQLRLRLYSDEADWVVLVPVHLGAAKLGRLRGTGSPPDIEPGLRRLPGGWREVVLTFKEPQRAAFSIAVVLARDLARVNAHFVGTDADVVALHGLSVAEVVTGEEVEAEQPGAPPAAEVPAAPPPAAPPPGPAQPERVLVKGKLLSAPRTAQLFAERAEIEARYATSPAAARIAALKDRWKGKRAFIIGNGPSLKQQDLLPLRDELTFFTNWGFLHPEYEAIRPKFHCSSSHEIFGGWGAKAPRLNEDFATKFAARSAGVRKVFSWRFEESLRAAGTFEADELDFMLFDRPKFLIDEIGGIDLDVRKVMHDGYTVVITFCIPLAVHLGVKEIILLGCDCDYGISQANDPKQYFYPTALHTTSTSAFDSLARIWADGGPVFKTYELVERDLRAAGVRLINATAGGRLDCIPRARYEDLLEREPA